MSNSKQSGRFVITGPGVYKDRKGDYHVIVENEEGSVYPWKSAVDDTETWTNEGSYLSPSYRRETGMDLIEKIAPLPSAVLESKDHSSSSLAQLLQNKFSGENFTQQAVEIEILRWLVDNNVRLVSCA